MPLETSYTSQGSPSAGSTGSSVPSKGKYWPLSKLKKAYLDYLDNKREEMDEQTDSRRYYHGSQWTTEQISALQKRKQPIMTFNRIQRKIDAVVGLVENQRRDPKAYARTPQHEEGAELATAAIRYVLDDQDWNAESPIVALHGAIDGIAGIELDLTQGEGDPEVTFSCVDTQSFFYDARSYYHDFDDARYLGAGRWLDEDIAKETFPDADFGDLGSSSDLTSSTDRERRWFRTDGVTKRIRIVDIWYKHRGKWCWAVFTGSAILDEGESPFKDEYGKQFPKYVMFSANVDQDGDRYGLVRVMKSAQDGINAKQSKMQHMIASKRLFISSAGGLDVEKTRTEMARADGVVVTHGNINDTLKADDQSFDFTGLAKLLELNLLEIENFGPNPALVGQGGVENSSGRAIALLQQAGVAELGPYILAYKGWKIRVYRAIWNILQEYWKAERWIRVTDDEGLAQFIQINGLQMDPQTGKPKLFNEIASLDVDIILDEAPDSLTIQQQSFEVLQALGPTFMERYPELAIELSPLDNKTKKMIRDKQKQAQEQQQPVQEMEMAGAAAEVKEREASAGLKQAQAVKAMAEAQAAPIEALMSGQGTIQPQDYEPPPEIQDAQAVADIRKTEAETEHKLAQARKTHVESDLAPQQMVMDHVNAQADREQQAQQSNADRAVQVHENRADRQEQRRAGDADRKIAAKKATQKPAPRK